jgi:hypothetical protein
VQVESECPCPAAPLTGGRRHEILTATQYRTAFEISN